MSTPIESILEINRRARHVLIQELGVIDAMRFLSQFREGNGNYTTEREQLLAGDTVTSIVAGIREQRDTEK